MAEGQVSMKSKKLGMKLDRVDARGRLAMRRDPYWQRLSEGRYVGFRRLSDSTPGTWLARFYDGQKYHTKPLGDFATIDAKDRYDAAKAAAEEWFNHLNKGGSTKRHTVKTACEARVKDRRTEKSEAAATDAQGRFKRLVYGDPKAGIECDPIADIELAKLTPRHLAEWKARVLANGGSRGSYNRNATALRAALNLAYMRLDVASNHAWRNELKPYKDVDGQRELYLKRPARAKLLDKATPEAQRYILTLLLLPLRPGDVAKLLVEHFDARQKTLAIPSGKTKARVIPLPAEAVTHFKACAKNKLPLAALVSRDDGSQWKKEAWRDAIQEAAAAAKLPVATCAYTLRHCVITDLVTGGVDLFTVAKLAGTSIRMIEKHYGHLSGEHARSALEKLALG